MPQKRTLEHRMARLCYVSFITIQKHFFLILINKAVRSNYGGHFRNSHIPFVRTSKLKNMAFDVPVNVERKYFTSLLTPEPNDWILKFSLLKLKQVNIIIIIIK